MMARKLKSVGAIYTVLLETVEKKELRGSNYKMRRGLRIRV